LATKANAKIVSKPTKTKASKKKATLLLLIIADMENLLSIQI